MDQPTPPTAAELGISDAAYERILRDLRQRNGEDEAPAAPRRQRRSRWVPLVVFGLVTAVALLTRLGAADGDDG